MSNEIVNSKYFFYLLRFQVFISGASVMGLELLGSRLIWANGDSLKGSNVYGVPELKYVVADRPKLSLLYANVILNVCLYYYLVEGQ